MLDSLVRDVNTALLYGEIDEEIIMKSPVGMEEIDPGSSSENCYQLLTGIYGLCQAARQFWKKFVNTAKKESFGFQVSPADLCMLFKQNELGICIIIMYVDDMLIIGKREQIQEFENKLQKEFSVKIQHNLADYLGCESHMNKVITRGNKNDAKPLSNPRTVFCAPKGPFLTDSWSWMKSSARHTLSNQQAQPKQAETVNLIENDAKSLPRPLAWLL